MIHSAIARFDDEHEDWIFIRHEDLSREPMEGFAALYSRLGLAWSDRVATKVEEMSDPLNPSETAVAASHHRDSRRAIVAWKKRLTAQQVSAIRRATEPIASRYYSDDDW